MVGGEKRDTRDLGSRRQRTHHEAVKGGPVRGIDAARGHLTGDPGRLVGHRVEKAFHLLDHYLDHGLGFVAQQRSGVLPGTPKAEDQHPRHGDQRQVAEAKPEQRADGNPNSPCLGCLFCHR